MITRSDAFRIWLKIGLLSFGGPAGQIALMHKTIVEEKNWVSESRFLHALNFCMLLPGPEAMQLATYLGWLLHKTRGGLVAGLLFILPSFTLMLCLSAIYAAWHAVPFVSALFYGLKSAVLVIVVEALLRIGKRSLRNNVLYALALASFVAIFFFAVPFPVIIIAAGIIGFKGDKKLFAPKPAAVASVGDKTSILDAMIERGDITHLRPDNAHALKVLVVGIILWWMPTLLVFVLSPPPCAAACITVANALPAIGPLFSKMAVVTFGGAYAALAYVAQEAVSHYHWLSPEDMLNGLGLAETTPGPLILVVEYVGYLAGYNMPGALPKHAAGLLAALLTGWVTFVPCFIWIFLGAPYIEQLHGKPALTAALSAITAAVTGVILNLAVWFGLHVLFAQVEPRSIGMLTVYDASNIQLPAAAIAAGAAIAIFRLKWGVPAVLVACGAAGLLLRLF